MRRHLATFLAATAVASPCLAVALSDASKADMMRRATVGLRDPRSAEFQWPDYPGGGIYCGLINAKNAYGGFVGFRNFLVFLSDEAAQPDPTIVSVVTDTGEKNAVSDMVYSLCSGRGYPVQ